MVRLYHMILWSTKLSELINKLRRFQLRISISWSVKLTFKSLRRVKIPVLQIRLAISRSLQWVRLATRSGFLLAIFVLSSWVVHCQPSRFSWPILLMHSPIQTKMSKWKRSTALLSLLCRWQQACGFSVTCIGSCCRHFHLVLPAKSRWSTSRPSSDRSVLGSTKSTILSFQLRFPVSALRSRKVSARRLVTSP